MEQVPDHPMIRQIERTGYPSWYEDDAYENADDGEETDE